ncbi:MULTISPECIES: 30S ribosomal protein S9 [Methanocorpusculum]|jgi:small subunit ribosomal protein S9|uniref:Small ribosomal subunit protein uS9 n=2 Tax=root TaxID=1 RepID=A2SSV4_METLZ|nr:MULTISPECIES: 30S ribosomal protein S9 [Methanocorpusculum]RBQ24724.1 MAG: 30S ribosomal protein S9 [Methanocorpusculum sp. MCE]ABN07410.1 ribosomal protein S9 [Methanocorpusculum labreanum Z]MDD2248883.1 30S ribosomal protein S9 [Methanocorpusculum sp.]MDD3912764.1 30S ribosomal protein S9 [Methanocorpusculum sp.]MDY3202632.1 30S ribosomal protein S9 [Methanocorpusculum sp.]
MKIINTSGKRKTAIARATLREGKGRVRINSVPLEVYGNEIIRMKISEALALAPGSIDNVDVDIDVSGGGVMGQAEAIRTALGRGILSWTNDPKIKEVYLSYDRTLLVNDSRQKEAKKPHGRGARARFQKSYR